MVNGGLSHQYTEDNDMERTRGREIERTRERERNLLNANSSETHDSVGHIIKRLLRVWLCRQSFMWSIPKSWNARSFGYTTSALCRVARNRAHRRKHKTPYFFQVQRSNLFEFPQRWPLSWIWLSFYEIFMNYGPWKFQADISSFISSDMQDTAKLFFHAGMS